MRKIIKLDKQNNHNHNHNNNTIKITNKNMTRNKIITQENESLSPQCP